MNISMSGTSIAVPESRSRSSIQKADMDGSFLRAVARFPRPGGAAGDIRRGDVLAILEKRSLARPQWRCAVHDLRAQQPPLYYRLMAPVYRLCGGRDKSAAGGIDPAADQRRFWSGRAGAGALVDSRECARVDRAGHGMLGGVSSASAGERDARGQ